MRRKAIFLCAIFLAGMAGMAAAQQITRYAVVDLNRILESFYRDSKVLRDFEEKQRSVQAEIDKMQKELKDLQQSRVQFQAANDQVKVLELDASIQKKRDFIKDYYKVKTEELETQKNGLFESSEFASEVYGEIQKIAEADGYSMVMDWKRSMALRFLIWYSPSIDITDKVIESLSQKKK
jgi:outer membrane protein